MDLFTDESYSLKNEEVVREEMFDVQVVYGKIKT